MEAFLYNLRSPFKYQNKYFFEKTKALLEFYKAENDDIYFDEKINGTGYVKLIKRNYNNLELKIELYCNDSHEWKIKMIFDNNVKELQQHYTEEDFDILQVQKELMKYVIR